MLRAAARLARAGSAAVSAAAGLLMLALLAFGGFALWQDAAVSQHRRAVVAYLIAFHLLFQ